MFEEFEGTPNLSIFMDNSTDNTTKQEEKKETPPKSKKNLDTIMLLENSYKN